LKLDVPSSVLLLNVDNIKVLLASLKFTGQGREEDVGIFIENPIVCNLLLRLPRLRKAVKPSVLESAIRLA